MKTRERGMTMLVMVTLLAVVFLGAETDLVLADGPVCVGNLKQVCSGGTCTWQESDECTSSGSTEPGATGCTPGAYYQVLTCDESCWCTACGNRCSAEGAWEATSCSSQYIAGCFAGEKRACYQSGMYEPPECWTVPENETPCEDLDWSATGIQCAAAYGLSASVTVPCQRISRLPYPRGLVAAPMNLTFSPGANVSWVEDWSSTLDYHECAAIPLKKGKRMIRNYRIGLAWGRMDEMAPRWELQESGGGVGYSLSVAWQKSSFFGDECGPGLGGETLPAFRGRLYTSWTAYYRVQYELQKMIKECHTDGGCEERGDCRYACSRDDDDIKEWGTKEVDVLCDTDDDGDGIPDGECWKDKDTGWVAFDLREFGYPTPYFVSNKSGPIVDTDPGYAACNGFCVPVIEVQGIIENPREP
jgi:hypothetical protein